MAIGMAALWRLGLALCLSLGVAAQSRPVGEAAEALRKGDFARARVLAEQATVAEPLSAAAWKLLGMAFAAENRLEEAREPFARACDLKPNEPGACYYLGRTAYFLSRLPDAEAAFALAMKLRGDRPRATLGLAMTMAADGKAAEAEALFQRALALKAEGAAEEFGLFLYRAGRHREGVALLEKTGATEALDRVRKELAAAPAPAPVERDWTPIALEAMPLPMVVRNSAAGEKYLVETMMGGLAVLDYDNDGFPDLYITNGAALPSLNKTDERFWNRLFRNRGDGSFEDVTERVGVAGRGFSMGAAAGDYDGDGWIDLFVVGVRENILYRNRGDGSFEDVSASAGVGGDGQWSVAAAWLDFDRDGRLDLFVARYVEWAPGMDPFCGGRAPGHRTYCHPRLYKPLTNLLYRNEGGGRFRNVSAETGIAAHPGKAMGLAMGDFDNDGWMDLFVGNDALPNSLFLNRAGRFEEAATQSGVALLNDGRPISSMGASVGDIDNDGNEEIVVSALSNETFPLFRNLGEAAFQDITAPSGIAAQILPYAGWGVGFVDLDNDGFLDIFSANSHVMDNAEISSSRASRQPNTVLRNRGAGRFALEVFEAAGKAFHRGAAFADFDRDGRIDVAVSRLNEAPVVLWNRTRDTGHWLSVLLPATAIGARVHCATRGGVRWGRLAPHSSYASSNQHAVHLGLGEDSVVNELTITWPDGCVQTLHGVKADQHLRVERNCAGSQTPSGR
ncbi:MAG: FG-GAP-like repeat-containing protein [Bryobacterales bacterium]|nr:FG-GAP-like repeat-containing protein [Bryobacterales bacterium]